MRSVTRVAGTSLLLAGFAAVSLVHAPAQPRRDELRLAEAGLTFTVNETLEPGLALELRERFDRDANGSLDDDESASAAAWFAARVHREIVLRIDAQPVVAAVTSAVIESGEERAGGHSGDDFHAIATIVLEARWPAGCACWVAVEDRGGALGSDGMRRAVPLRVVSATGETLALSAASAPWTGRHVPSSSR